MNLPHPEFATWYSAVDLGDSNHRIDARSSAVSKIQRRLTYERATFLVDLMLAERVAMDGAGSKFIRTPCRETDATFPVSGNEAELVLLAEISLAIVMDRKREDSLAGKIAESIFSALANGRRDFSSVTDILNRSRDIIQRQGRYMRLRPRLPKKPKSYLASLDFTSCFRNVSDLSDMAQAKVMMNGVSVRVRNCIRRVANSARAEREALEHHIKLQDEELDLLWWASNGYSSTTRGLFAEMTSGARAFIAAREAAHRTQMRPGPCSVLGLLERAGVVAGSEVSIAEAFGTIDSELTHLLRVSNATIRTPLHLGITMKHESSNADTWLGHWSSRTGIDSVARCSELEIAQLVYVERLVLGAFGDGE